MEEKTLACTLLILIVLPFTKGGVPGTFFWRPRLGLDLSIPSTTHPSRILLPSKETVREGVVVMIEGYQVGMTVVALASGFSSAGPYPHLNPISAYFYTNAYRWALRHLSLVPLWIGGSGGHYVDTHRVWRRRWFYMDEFVPTWLRKALPYVKESEWKQEEEDWRRFKKHAEAAFGRHYRAPRKQFNNWKSLETVESPELLDSEASSAEK